MDRVQKKVKYDDPQGREHQALFDNYDNGAGEYDNQEVIMI